VKIFSSKFKATGLKKAILTLLHEVTGKPHRDFEVTEVLLIEKVHKDTLFTVRTQDGKEFDLYLSRFGCMGEHIYSGLPTLVGLPGLPTVYHVTPQGEEVLLKPKEEGINIYHDDSVTSPGSPRRRVVGSRGGPAGRPRIASERHCGTGTTLPPRRGKW